MELPQLAYVLVQTNIRLEIPFIVPNMFTRREWRSLTQRSAVQKGKFCKSPLTDLFTDANEKKKNDFL